MYMVWGKKQRTNQYVFPAFPSIFLLFFFFFFFFFFVSSSAPLLSLSVPVCWFVRAKQSLSAKTAAVKQNCFSHHSEIEGILGTHSHRGRGRLSQHFVGSGCTSQEALCSSGLLSAIWLVQFGETRAMLNWQVAVSMRVCVFVCGHLECRPDFTTSTLFTFFCSTVSLKEL